MIRERDEILTVDRYDADWRSVALYDSSFEYARMRGWFWPWLCADSRIHAQARDEGNRWPIDDIFDDEIR